MTHYTTPLPSLEWKRATHNAASELLKAASDLRALMLPAAPSPTLGDHIDFAMSAGQMMTLESALTAVSEALANLGYTANHKRRQTSHVPYLELATRDLQNAAKRLGIVGEAQARAEIRRRPL